MKRAIKRAVYHACKWTGLMRLARRRTRDKLRILCYHGFALGDEDRFRPQLFMRGELFTRRMGYLRRNGYAVIPLCEAVDRLMRGELPASATVVTFDDGFYSTWAVAGPVLGRLSLPGTIYVTTYYCLKRNPVFRLVVQYMFWKTDRSRLDTSGLGLDDDGEAGIETKARRHETSWRIINLAEKEFDEPRRVELCRELGRRLGVDYEAIVASRFLSLMTPEEIARAAAAGVGIQLHTHRHNLPEDAEGIRREIEDNQQALKDILGARPRHFCYPSGIFSRQRTETLRRMEILSAATCEVGLNARDTDRLLLLRFLDGNHISWIEFEAEMSGLAEIARSAGRCVKRLLGRRDSPVAGSR